MRDFSRAVQISLDEMAICLITFYINNILSIGKILIFEILNESFNHNSIQTYG